MSYASFLYQLFAWMPWTGYYNSIIWMKLSEKATWQCNCYHYPKYANSCEASLAFPLHRHYHAVLYSASLYLTERLECNGKQAAIHSNTLNLRGRQIDHSFFFLFYLFFLFRALLLAQASSLALPSRLPKKQKMAPWKFTFLKQSLNLSSRLEVVRITANGGGCTPREMMEVW